MAEPLRSPLIRWGALALMLAAVLPPYAAPAWWAFIPATVLIPLLSYWREPGAGAANLGLPSTPRAWAETAALTIVSFFCFRILVAKMADLGGVVFDRSAWSTLHYARPIFQALDEEMLFRGLLLSALARALRSRPAQSRTGLSALVAAWFAVAHIAFYAARDHSLIGPVACANYFLFGLVCNELYFRVGHIGPDYALHAGWNLTRFAGRAHWQGRPLTEGEAVRCFEGSPLLLVILLAFCGAIFLAPLLRSDEQDPSRT